LSYRVIISDPALSFVRRLSPGPRGALKKSFRDLRKERGDIRSLDDPLAGHYRLRVGKYRAIFRYVDGMTIEVVFVEERKLVYEVYEEQLARKLRS
jgi:mRNA interferase RelE/StbE